MNFTPYEQQQLEGIRAWKTESPGVVRAATGVANKPLLWLTRKVVPTAAIRGLLDGLNAAARWLADRRDIRRDGQVDRLAELRAQGDLRRCDRLAEGVQRWAVGLAAVEGAAAGATGLVGLTADVPAVITLALRTVHKVGYCYGYNGESEADRNFALGVLAASGANSLAEKTAALATLRSIEVTIASQSWRALAELAAHERLGQAGAIIAVKKLAEQLGVNLTRRKALQALPVVGAVVGASANAWFIKELGWAARRAFQERWLVDSHKVLEV